MALLTLAALTMGYLALTNSNATAGYELRVLEERAAELHDTTRALELRTLATRSEEQIVTRITDMGFVPVAAVRYAAPAHAVALQHTHQRN